jgi:TldD protein
MMVLGRRFGRDILTIADDGSIPGLRGSHRYDDEGTPTGRTDLIKDGVLVGRLHGKKPGCPTACCGDEWPADVHSP